MKKIMLLCMLALVSTFAVAQQKRKTGVKRPVAAKVNNKLTLRTRMDSLSYCVGMSQADGLTEYLKESRGIDLNNLDYFTKGLKFQKMPANMKENQRKAYETGCEIGSQVNSSMIPGINKMLFGDNASQSISKDLLLSGFVSGYTGKGGLMTMEQARTMAQTLISAVKAEAAMKQYGANKAAGEQFLAENAKKPDVHTLASGVQYKIIKAGTGPIPTDKQMVKVHYKGWTIDGKVFDSSYDRGEPTQFRCNQVIKGWTDALTHMTVGSTWEVYIPQELAYGEREMSDKIKPFSVLIFTIELLEVTD